VLNCMKVDAARNTTETVYELKLFRH